MLHLLKNLFENQNEKENIDVNEDLNILCGLMIEAANTDGVIDENEIDQIKNILVNVFKEEIDDVTKSLEIAIENKNNSNSLFYYSSRINKKFTYEKKVLLIEKLWEIMLADGNVHEYESSLLRRLSGLLYISDVDSGNAKKSALNKILNNK